MEKKKEAKLVPKLRFPEFKKKWSIRKVGDFVEERASIARQDLPLYSLTIENGVVPKSKRYERSFLVKGKEDAYKKMLPGDFAFNPMNLRFGALAMHKGDFSVAVSKYYNIFYCNNEGSPEYLESYLTCYNMIQYYNRMSTGTLEEKKRVHYLDFIHFKKAFPTLPEQEKIASFLSAVDKKIQQLTAKKELLEQYKKGVMQKIFSQEIRFTDDNGKDYPDWQEKELGDVLDYTQPTKFLVKTTDYDDAYKTPVLTAGKTFVLGYTAEAFGIFKEDLPVIIFDDFTTAFKFVDFHFKAKSSAMKILKAKYKAVNMSFVYESMKVIRFPLGEHKRYWISEYQYMKINYPCEEEQRKIASFLSSIDQRIASVQSQLTQTQTFKKGLLQQLFV